MKVDRDALRRALNAPGRPPTRGEARLTWVCLLSMPVTFGGAPWWEPLSIFFVGTLVLAYMFWRLRTVHAPLLPDWQRRAALIAGWSPRLLANAYTVLWLAGLVAVTLSWLT